MNYSSKRVKNLIKSKLKEQIKNAYVIDLDESRGSTYVLLGVELNLNHRPVSFNGKKIVNFLSAISNVCIVGYYSKNKSNFDTVKIPFQFIQEKRVYNQLEITS